VRFASAVPQYSSRRFRCTIPFMIDLRHESLLTVSAAARILGKTPRTIRGWIRSGSLEGIRVAGRFYTSLEAIERASEPIESRRVQPSYRSRSKSRSRKALEEAGWA
jgi:excisionase family DNA binding protein